MAGNDAYTVSLLHMNGADQSTTFTDSAVGGTHTWTANGAAKIVTAQSEFGGASGSFGSASDYISTPYSADFSFGAGDFTLDFWVSWHANPASGTSWLPYYLYVDANNYNIIEWYNNGTHRVLYFETKVSGTIKGQYYFTWDATLDTWYHVAFVRNGANFYIFINGVSQTLTQQTAISTNSITPTGQAPMNVGALNGWLDEVRISKGIARWTSNFTSPTAEYGQDFTKNLSDSMSLSDDIGKTPTLSKSDSLSMAESISKTPGLSRSDAITLSDLKVWTISKLLADGFTLSDAIAKTPGLSKADVIILLEVLSWTANISFSDGISLNDEIRKKMMLSKADALSLDELLEYLNSLALYLSDTIILSDSFIKTFTPGPLDLSYKHLEPTVPSPAAEGPLSYSRLSVKPALGPEGDFTYKKVK